LPFCELFPCELPLFELPPWESSPCEFPPFELSPCELPPCELSPCESSPPLSSVPSDDPALADDEPVAPTALVVDEEPGFLQAPTSNAATRAAVQKHVREMAPARIMNLNCSTNSMKAL
jgi:hypothetical protein